MPVDYRRYDSWRMGWAVAVGGVSHTHMESGRRLQRRGAADPDVPQAFMIVSLAFMLAPQAFHMNNPMMDAADALRAHTHSRALARESG